MFGWFSKLAGKSDLLDKAAAGLDALVLTDEEKIKYHAERHKNFIELEKEVNKQSTPRALTRRYLTLLVAVPYITLTTIACIIEFLAALGIINAVELSKVDNLLEWMALAFMSAVIFYFGTQAVDKFKK
jgi:hypothetical protein